MERPPIPEIPESNYSLTLINFFQITPFDENYCILDVGYTGQQIMNIPSKTIIASRFLIHNDDLKGLGKLVSLPTHEQTPNDF